MKKFYLNYKIIILNINTDFIGLFHIMFISIRI